MKILVFLAVWKRPEITEICFMGLERLRNNSPLPIEAFAVISEETMIPLCNKYGIKWTMHPNEPVGNKKNHGLTEAMKLDWDYLLEIGSDDLVKDELIELYKPLLGKAPMFGTKDAVIINSVDGQCRRLRSDTVYGLGRCISRDVFEKHCYGVDVIAKTDIVCRGRSVGNGKKGFFLVAQAKELEGLGRVEIIGEPRYRLWKDEINRGLDNNSDFFLMTQGVDYKTVKTDKPLTLDIKGPDNIWKFSPEIGEPYLLGEALDGLSDDEQGAIISLWKRKKSNVEYA